MALRRDGRAVAILRSGGLRVRFGGIEEHARATLELDGFRVWGAVALDELPLYLSAPRWLRGVVRPHADTALRVRVMGNKLGVVVGTYVGPHEVGSTNTERLEVIDSSLSCDALSLQPARYEPLPASVEHTEVAPRPRWYAREGATLSLAPVREREVVSLTLGMHEVVVELSRDGDRCRVLLPLKEVSVVGWVPCTDLGSIQGGRSEPKLLPLGGKRLHPANALRCARRLPLFVAIGDAQLEIGEIRAGTTIPIVKTKAEAIPVSPPTGIDPAPGSHFFVPRAATSGCQWLSPP